MHFATHGDVESAALYLEHGASLEARDEEQCSRPLAWAAMNGQERMVEFLLRRGAALERPDDPAWATPLAWATRKGHQGVVRILQDFARSGALPPRDVERYDALARDLVDAYGPGDENALARIVQHFRIERALTWDQPPLEVRVARLRKGVNERLQTIRGTHPATEALSLEDARTLIAGSEGFASWEALVRSIKTANTG